MNDTITAGDAIVRDAVDADMNAIQAIYAHHVLHGLASFEEVAPDVAELRRRRDEILKRRLPYRVADVGGAVKGYAYAGPYRPRSAYRYTVEDSVYIAHDMVGRGIGRRLLQDIVDTCTGLGYRQMIAIIGDSGNLPSISLHRRLGFVHAGTVRSAGFKLGRWVDSVIMQRPLGEGDSTLPQS